MERTQCSFLFVSLILLAYQYAAIIGADEGRDCQDNLFSGSLQFMNAINYFITRFISANSASLAVLFIFWKPKRKLIKG